jgi:hypothetical protein
MDQTAVPKKYRRGGLGEWGWSLRMSLMGGARGQVFNMDSLLHVGGWNFVK